MSNDSRAELKKLGEQTRREVLGDKYVDAAMNNANAFNQGLQDLLNEYCWGDGWNRGVLSRRDRSLINLGMLTALGKSHEVAVHTRGSETACHRVTHVAETDKTDRSGRRDCLHRITRRPFP